MKTIPAGKFIMVCITCKLMNSIKLLEPYKGYKVLVRNEKEYRQVDRYFQELGINPVQA